MKDTNKCKQIALQDYYEDDVYGIITILDNKSVMEYQIRIDEIKNKLSNNGNDWNINEVLEELSQDFKFEYHKIDYCSEVVYI